jgi:hypothetical protein
LLLFSSTDKNSNKTIDLSEKNRRIAMNLLLITLIFEYHLKRSSLNKRPKDKETSSSVPFGGL